MKKIVYRIYVIVQHKLPQDVQVFLQKYDLTFRMQRRTIGGAEGHHQVELCPSFNDKVWTFLVFLKGAGYFHSAGQSFKEG